MDIKKLLEVFQKYIRKRYYYIFKKKYIAESISRRKGKCKKCGYCEEIRPMIGLKYCKFYDKKNKKCKIYPTQPGTCHAYPFDEKDKWNYTKGKCGYYWKK